MIQVEITRDKEGYRGFTSRGHAEFDEYGRDIVCAAVSVLTQNTANSIEQFTGDRFSGELDEKNGSLSVTFPDRLSSEASLLMDSMVLGLKSIQESYGSRYLKIRFREV